jgi:hypothetical protein
MGIEATCPHGHRTRVKDRFASKRIYCPQCGVKFYVPSVPPCDAELQLAVPEGATTKPLDPFEERPAARWSIAVPGGDASEPISGAELLAWLDSGVATGIELVWRSDWTDWRPVTDVFPDRFQGSGRLPDR